MDVDEKDEKNREEFIGMLKERTRSPYSNTEANTTAPVDA